MRSLRHPFFSKQNIHFNEAKENLINSIVSKSKKQLERKKMRRIFSQDASQMRKGLNSFDRSINVNKATAFNHESGSKTSRIRTQVSKPQEFTSKGQKLPKNTKNGLSKTKSDAYLFGKFSKTATNTAHLADGTAKPRPRKIDFGYQIPSGYKKIKEQLDKNNKPLLMDESSKPKIMRKPFSRRKMSEDEIGSMTIRELSKLDPKRALSELTVKYRRLKEVNS